jgi:hypothetical protein
MSSVSNLVYKSIEIYYRMQIRVMYTVQHTAESKPDSIKRYQLTDGLLAAVAKSFP